MNWLAASDLGLAIAVVIAAALASERRLAVAGFALVGIAALTGVLRYAGWEALAELHRGASFAAGAIGLPLVALAFPGQRHVLPLAALFVAGALVFWNLGAWRLVAGIGAMVLWAACALRVRGRDPQTAWLIAGGIGFTLAAAPLAGAPGDLLGMPKLAWLHYALAGAQLCFGVAFQRRLGAAEQFTPAPAAL